MLKKRMIYVVLMGILLGLTGAVLAISNTTFAQDDNLLQLNDLPAGAIALKNETYIREDLSHPINGNAESNIHNLPEDAQKTLLSYENVHSFSAFLPKQAFVAHYLYEYETAEQAEAAVKLYQMLQDEFVVEHNVTVQMTETHQGRLLRGRSSMLLNEKGEPTYWFVGHQGNNLNILMVDGLDISVVDSVADSLLGKLSNQLD